MSRALAQNLAILGLLQSVQDVGMKAEDCLSNHGGSYYACDCSATMASNAVYEAFEELGEKQWGDDESATHKKRNKA